MSTANNAPASGCEASCCSLSSKRALLMNNVFRSGPPKATLVM